MKLVSGYANSLNELFTCEFVEVTKTWNGLKNRLENGLSKFLWKASILSITPTLIKIIAALKMAIFIIRNHAFKGWFTTILCPALKLKTTVDDCANLINHSNKTDYASKLVCFLMQWLGINRSFVVQFHAHHSTATESSTLHVHWDCNLMPLLNKLTALWTNVTVYSSSGKYIRKQTSVLFISAI